MWSGRLRQIVSGILSLVIVLLVSTTSSSGPSLANAESAVVSQTERPTPNLLEQPYIEIGKQAPDLALPDINGKIVWLADLRGKIVIVTFWATWCTPCRAELPELVGVYQKLQERGIEILAINVGESPDQVNAFVTDLGIKFPVLLDAKGFAVYAFGVHAIPTSFIVDRDGILRHSQMGGMTLIMIDNILKDLE
ncbi:MAG: TlpA family protein disulfide reductase [Anaerolineae bacterium]